MKSPLLILASCFALGILLASFFSLTPLHVILALAATSVCLLGGFWAVKTNRLRMAAVLALAGFVLAGVAATAVFHNRFSADHIHNLASWGFDLKNDVQLEGMVTTAPVRSRYGYVFDLECRKIGSASEWRHVQGKVQLRMFIPSDPKSWAAADALRLSYGDVIRAPVRLQKPTIYRNPGGFDFRWWMETVRNISWEGEIRSPLVVDKLSQGQASWFSTAVTGIRSRLLNGIDRLYAPWLPEGRVGAVLKAVLLGDRSSLDSDTIENFRQSGLYHLLVIAGLHVGLLAAVILFFLQLLRFGESSRATLLLIFLVTYALLVEQRAPTLRATLMIIAYFLARFLYRRRAALNAVGLAALVLLVYRPAWLFEAGFDLSFSAALLIAGLALPILERTTLPYRTALAHLSETERDLNLTPRQAQFRLDLRAIAATIRKRFPVMERHPKVAENGVVIPASIVLWTVDLILFSAIIQIGLFMPMAETFHRITVLGIGLNILALPLMTVLIALAIPTVILSATLPALAIWPGKLLLWVTQTILALTELHRLPEWLSYRIPSPPFWVDLGFALALIATAWTIRRNLRAFWMSLAGFTVFILLVICYPFAPRISRGTLALTALDCGRGEALFAVLPNGMTLLMNAGGRERFGPATGRWNPGEEIVSPYLWSLGLRKLDIAVLANGSDENIRAMNAVIDNFKVSELWHGPRIFSPAYMDLLRAARERGVAVREITAGDEKNYGGTGVQVLWPPAAARDVRSSSPADSAVLRITCAGASALLGGNAGSGIEQGLTRGAEPVASDVLEIALAKSAKSFPPELFVHVNPKIVLITGDENEGIGSSLLPAPSGASGVQIFDTALDGAVTVNLEGKRMNVKCYRSPENFN